MALLLFDEFLYQLSIFGSPLKPHPKSEYKIIILELGKVVFYLNGCILFVGRRDGTSHHKLGEVYQSYPDRFGAEYPPKHCNCHKSNNCKE